MLTVRDEKALVPLGRQPLPEHERINRLRMQDGKPLLPPPSIQHLMPTGELPDWKTEEAIAVWNQSRQELRASGSNYEAAERLVFLSMVLAQRFQARGDKLRQREMLEGALDVLTLPRHRQIMRGFLCRAAVRAGDLVAAESWLQPCDSQSDDIQMDSAWRFSRAFIDTAKGNFQRVIEVLGQTANDYPIEDASDDVCAVFRANAWEKLGRPDVAVGLLRERLALGGGQGRETVRQVVELYRDWHLCVMSYPQASAGYAQSAAGVAARRAAGGIGGPFAAIGGLMAVGGGIMVGIVMLGVIGILDLDHGAYMGLGTTGGIFLLMGLIFLPIGIAMKRSAARAAWLRVHGLSGRGVIQDMQHTGLTINNTPQMMFTLMVTLPGRPPYQAHAKMLMNEGMAGRLVGGTVSVRVHPQNPAEIALEVD